ncbi:AvaI/BsoBI family type II restriction endonuclease [Polynucleobacter sp. AM-7D1]|uniref:AvaI/BsoBI family type II restriction endonuclease n=1 Tax=Polynucleobacter sp. AM-7D1 TaxID=2689102 RepID=UPI001BFE0775|nr:AvaI/BsoBI family type II restriction endonuclease [Polynucleobacter sp. AM-7D1]QWE27919.1 hypothetical protein GQ359_05725 [Polynucleobacter sp. AM-7D1]
MLSKIINSSKDLETTHAATRSGFLEMALRKNREAAPYLDEARALHAIAQQYNGPEKLAKDPKVRGPLSEASGISSKANSYLSEKDIDEIIKEFITKFLAPAGEKFADEIVYRFLLAKGDSLGGRMRNIAGAIAGEKFTRFLIANLRNSQIDFEYLLKDSSRWQKASKVTQDDLISIKMIRWTNINGSGRQIIYNTKVPIVDKNIDITMFKKFVPITKPELKTFLASANNYLALGELKGGIDPAGADEHWKTANTALQRIRNSFNKAGNPVKTFFVGGAIEASMAQEIFNQVQKLELSKAANLTNEDQLAALCGWLIEL